MTPARKSKTFFVDSKFLRSPKTGLEIKGPSLELLYFQDFFENFLFPIPPTPGNQNPFGLSDYLSEVLETKPQSLRSGLVSSEIVSLII